VRSVGHAHCDGKGLAVEAAYQPAERAERMLRGSDAVTQ
jgi:hypothetical protein